MARGTTLIRLLDMYRAECRMSSNPAHNSQDRDRQIAHIQRVQEWLWADFDWPLLRVERFFYPQQGQRWYSPPEEFDIDRISKMEVFFNHAYCPLHPGIDAVHFTSYNSNMGVQQWPPQRWRIYEDEQIEIWPIPNQNASPESLDGQIKVTGIRKLRPLVADTDRADLDDRLLILFCAAEYLATKGDKASQIKQQQANQRYAKMRGSQLPRNKFRMFGVGEKQSEALIRRIPLAVYNTKS